MKLSNKPVAARTSDPTDNLPNGIPEDLVQIGKIVGAHGLNGTVKVHSFAESEEYFFPQNHLIILDTAGHLNSFEVVASRPYKNILRTSLVGVSTLEQAQELIGSEIYIKKTDLPPLEQGTYYWVDLLDLSVITRDGEYLGQVVEIIPTGANDVYVVKAQADEGEKEILIPALSSVVVDIDLDKRQICVELPEGLE